MEHYIKELEKWRDWYWQSYIKHQSSRANLYFNYKERADAYQNAINILNGVQVDFPDNKEVEGYSHLKYGEFPDEK